MNEIEIFEKALDGGTLGVLGFFAAVVWRTLKRWIAVLEKQEELITVYLEHIKKVEKFYSSFTDHMQNIRHVTERAEKDLSDVRDALVPSKRERNLIETTASSSSRS